MPVDASGELGATRLSSPWYFAFLAESALLFGNSVHVLPIAAFASEGDRDLSQACGGCCDRFRPRRCHGVVVRPGTNADAKRFAGSQANSVADANGHQFRSVGWRGGDEYRQQLHGATWRPGDEW